MRIRSMCLAFVVMLTGVAGADIVPAPPGPYLGQTAPGTVPELFAPDHLPVDGLLHSSPSFSPDGDEVFWSVIHREERRGEILTMKATADGWTAPAVAPFSGEHWDSNPSFSPDGSRVVFTSNRPGGRGRGDIWSVTRSGDGWGEPVNLGTPPNGEGSEVQPSVAADGSLYFVAAMDSVEWGRGLYWCRREGAGFAPREPLPAIINTPAADAYPFIAPDGSYLLFCSGRPGRKSEETDLYIAFRRADGAWGEPIQAGPEINDGRTISFPRITRDGKHLIFRSFRDGTDVVFWVDARVVTSLRPDPADYLGQTPPGDTPELFAPDIIGQHAHSAPTFTPDGDEIYWSTTSVDGAPRLIMRARRDGDRWAVEPMTDLGAGHHADQPFVSADGRTLIFAAKRSLQPGAEPTLGLWTAHRDGDDWSEPTPLDPSPGFWTPSLTRDGTLYCLGPIDDHEAKGYARGVGIYRCQLRDGVYAEPELLPEQINGKDSLDWCPFIAADESYLLFSSDRPGGYGNGDLYVCWRGEDGEWGEAKNLGAGVNTGGQERFPGVDLGGGVLFFTRGGGELGLHGLLWVLRDSKKKI